MKNGISRIACLLCISMTINLMSPAVNVVANESINELTDTEPALAEMSEELEESEIYPEEIHAAETDGEPLYAGDFDYDYDSQNEGAIVITRYKGSNKDVVIPSMIEGKPVVRLAANTFYKQDFIESIDIPDTVKSCMGAIKECNNIKVIKTPLKDYSLSYLFPSTEILSLEKVVIKGTEIRDYAFNFSNDGKQHIPMLTEVRLSPSMNKIGANAFSNSLIKEIIIPDTVSEIGRGAFSNCENLETVYLPAGLKTISSFMFSGCTSLNKVVLPDELEEIQEYAFSRCENLTSITNVTRNGGKHEGLFPPYTLRTVGDYAFNGCKSLNRVMLPKEIENMGKGILQGCTSIKVMDVPLYDNTKIAALYSFFLGNWADLEKLDIDKVLLYVGDTNVIPDRFFAGVPIKEIRIESGITAIGERAFSSSDNLESVTMADTVTQLGKGTFSGCLKLKSVMLSSELTEIPDSAFERCRNLEQVSYNGMSIVGEYVGEKIIQLPDKIESVGEHAFSECEKITVLNIPNSLKTIGKSAFKMCRKLRCIRGGKNVQKIQEWAFYQYSDGSLLETIVDPDISLSMLTYDWRSDYRTIKQRRKFTWGKDNFKFENYVDDIQDIDMSKHGFRLARKLIEVNDKLTASQIAYGVEETVKCISASGHCYGMVHLVDEILRGNGIVDYNMCFDPIHDLNNGKGDEDIDELLDWFVLKQSVPDSGLQLYKKGEYNYIQEFEKDLLVEQGLVAIIDFKDANGNTSSHAVFVYGVEKKEDNSKTKWEYPLCKKRYLVYDVNSSEQAGYNSIKDYNVSLSNNDEYNLYYNDVDDTFTIKNYKDKGKEITGIYYEKNDNFQNHDRLMKLSENGISAFNYKILAFIENGKKKINLLWNEMLGFESENSVYYASLPEKTDGLYIENTDKGALDLNLHIRDLYFDIDSQSVDSFTVSSDCVKVDGNLSNTKIELVSDKNPIPGYELVCVSVDGISNLRLDVQDDGIVASSTDGVNGFKISLENMYEEGRRCSFDISTDKDSVFIRKDNGKTEILEDSDNDGIYDKVIDSSLDICRVLFDVGASDVIVPEPKEVIIDQPYGDLPIPERKGYKFLGWFTSAEGGTIIDKTTIVRNASDHILYAHWEKENTEQDEETKKNEEMNSGKPGSTITAKKLDISKAFDIPSGVKTRFIIKNKSQKKLATVNRKGMLTTRKSGAVTVTLQKKEGKIWKDISEASYEIVVPKGSTISAGTAYYEGQQIDLNSLLKNNGVFHPNTWTTKTKSTVAVLDGKTGILTVKKENGSAIVNAVYGTGRYARKIKITIKINHKKVDISGAFKPTTQKKKYVIKNKEEKKLATVSNKGILTVKNSGTVTVSLFVKDGLVWKDSESKTFRIEDPMVKLDF